MTTPRDLLIITMDMPTTRPVERGDLSLALAGAELVDLLRAGAVRVEGEHLLADDTARPIADRLLDEAASSVPHRAPFESVAEFLWRRGRGLSAAYLAAFDEEGQLTRPGRRRWGLFRTHERVLLDSPDRRRAANRWAAEEPVLTALATDIGVRDKRTEESPEVADEVVADVLASVTEALAELAEERQRRARKLDDAAVTNYRRGY
ncbi:MULTISPECIES: GPP34 family phosphoprotein [unclassified Streptomyces]|uniref:GPP34 family phosphoprotein n=1 Tax=unclassified Streptomyces TaxID=2593676 RepID=UPI002E289B4F|nr:GPP34 family phosphoprotein [Streptomyces sp. NBC_00223]